jgi:hypothetical protein
MNHDRSLLASAVNCGFVEAPEPLELEDLFATGCKVVAYDSLSGEWLALPIVSPPSAQVSQPNQPTESNKLTPEQEFEQKKRNLWEAIKESAAITRHNMRVAVGAIDDEPSKPTSDVDLNSLVQSMTDAGVSQSTIESVAEGVREVAEQHHPKPTKSRFNNDGRNGSKIPNSDKYSAAIVTEFVQRMKDEGGSKLVARIKDDWKSKLKMGRPEIDEFLSWAESNGIGRIEVDGNTRTFHLTEALMLVK